MYSCITKWILFRKCKNRYSGTSTPKTFHIEAQTFSSVLTGLMDINKLLIIISKVSLGYICLIILQHIFFHSSISWSDKSPQLTIEIIIFLRDFGKRCSTYYLLSKKKCCKTHNSYFSQITYIFSDPDKSNLMNGNIWNKMKDWTRVHYHSNVHSDVHHYYRSSSISFFWPKKYKLFKMFTFLRPHLVALLCQTQGSMVRAKQTSRTKKKTVLAALMWEKEHGIWKFQVLFERIHLAFQI